MSYSVVITCDVCRVRGLNAVFDRPDETFGELLTALAVAGWIVTDAHELARLELTCPDCAARGAGELAALIELRSGVEDVVRSLGLEESGPYRDAWHSLPPRVQIVGAGVAIPRAHVHRLEGSGQIVPITTERLAARVVDEWSPRLTVLARHDSFVFTWKKDPESP